VREPRIGALARRQLPQRHRARVVAHQGERHRQSLVLHRAAPDLGEVVERAAALPRLELHPPEQVVRAGAQLRRDAIGLQHLVGEPPRLVHPALREREVAAASASAYGPASRAGASPRRYAAMRRNASNAPIPKMSAMRSDPCRNPRYAIAPPTTSPMTCAARKPGFPNSRTRRTLTICEPSSGATGIRFSTAQ